MAFASFTMSCRIEDVVELMTYESMFWIRAPLVNVLFLMLLMNGIVPVL